MPLEVIWPERSHLSREEGASLYDRDNDLPQPSLQLPLTAPHLQCSTRHTAQK
jgi:hypothetical protein